jgi:hypothetical protein
MAFHSGSNVVQKLQEHIKIEDYDDVFLAKISHCKHCKESIEFCMPAKNFSPGVCLLFRCQKSNEKCEPWYACMTCRRQLDKRRVKEHFSSQFHMVKCNQDCGLEDKEFQKLEGVSSCAFDDYGDDDSSVINEDWNNYFIDGHDLDEENMCESLLHHQMTTMQLDSIDPERTGEVNIEGGEKNLPPPKDLPLIFKSFGNESICNSLQVWHCLQGNPEMQIFWVAQHSSSYGGMQYLVARSFQRTEYILAEGIPTPEEAIWHVLNFIQYTSMSEKQRRRQALISRQFSEFIASSSSDLANKALLYAHRVKTIRDMSRYYGSTSVHSMWNTLPIPKVRNIDGIGYVSAFDIVRFVFAMGIEVDNIVVKKRIPLAIMNPNKTLSWIFRSAGHCKE